MNLQGQGKAEALRLMASRNVCLGHSVQAPLNVRKAWRRTEVASHPRHRWIHLVHVEEAGGRGGPAGSGSGNNAGRTHLTRRGCTRKNKSGTSLQSVEHALERRAPRGNMAQLLDALPKAEEEE